MSEISIDELMQKFPVMFQPEKAAGIQAAIQFNLTGEPEGKWVLHIQDQKCKIVEEELSNPTLTISAAGQDILDIFTGKLEGGKAFMQGKLKITGNMGLGMKLLSLFKF